jgi:hypothetical protein
VPIATASINPKDLRHISLPGADSGTTRRMLRPIVLGLREAGKADCE